MTASTEQGWIFGGFHPCAVEAMSEVGIDISDQYTKSLRDYMGKVGFNYLIIAC